MIQRLKAAPAVVRATSLGNSIQVEQVTCTIGAELSNVNLGAAAEDDQQMAEIRALLLKHRVLFFRDQDITRAQHVAFARRFGELEDHPVVGSHPDYPGLVQIYKTPDSPPDRNENSWHTDATWREKPPLGCVLRCIECPPVGGDTMWANAYKAYDELSPAMKDFCEGLSALHDAHPHGNPEQMAVHPVVRVHPVTKKKSLFVNEHFTRRIVELSHQESEALLAFLVRWIQSPRFTVRYHWTPGTIAMWDNRCTQHHVLNDFEGERVIQRVTVMGDRPVPARAPRWEPYIKYFSAASHRDRQLKKYLDSRSS
jgi:taurine dioxygenase